MKIRQKNFFQSNQYLINFSINFFLIFSSQTNCSAPFSLSLSLSLTHTFSLSLSLSLSHTHTLSLSLSLFFFPFGKTLFQFTINEGKTFSLLSSAVLSTHFGLSGITSFRLRYFHVKKCVNWDQTILYFVPCEILYKKRRHF